MTDTETITIVDDGDVILHVTLSAESISYLVCSHVLCASSIIFRKMLGKESNFAEAVALRESPPEPVPVSLEDDPVVMGIILQWLHFQHKKVPRKLSVDQLVQAAIICDKYGLHEALQLISETWTQAVRSTSENHPEDWLLISWVFGPEDIFTSTSRVLTLSGLSDSNGDLVFGEYKGTLHECVPASISGMTSLQGYKYSTNSNPPIEEMVRRREVLIESIRAHIRDLESKFLSTDWQANPVCTLRVKECDSLQLGLLYRCLLVSGAFSWSGSVNATRDALKVIPTLNYDTGGQITSGLHCGYCSRPNYSYGCTGITVNPAVIQHTNSNCSWVPKIHLFVDTAISGVKGFSFSEFSSRTWG